MSLAGLKKQFNKANQFVSEKIGGAKGTELDEDYVEMERKVDVTEKLVSEVMTKTQEYLQPNPASRAKLMTQAAWSKVRRTNANTLYPQPEGTLGEAMLSNGKELGYESSFGQACIETGEAFNRLAEAKYTLEDNVKQDFLEPLHHLQSKELKEIAFHRKKLAGRRLDYDCKKRKKEKGGVVPDEELAVAEEKFEESKELAENAMYNLLSNDVEQITQMKAFVESCLEYHKHSVDILTSLKQTLDSQCSEASRKPKTQHVPKRVASSVSHNSQTLEPEDSNGKTGSYSFGNHEYAAPTNVSSKPAAVAKKPMVKGLYDFDPESEGELGFREGDMIELLDKIDENWYEGKLNGQVGHFPINYVEVITPLP